MTEEKNEESIVLKTEQDKMNFLNDCLKEIKRINKSLDKDNSNFLNEVAEVKYLKNRELITTQIPELLAPGDTEAISRNLSSTEIPEEQKAGIQKILILAEIYNQVAGKIKGKDVNEPVNLTEVFKTNKSIWSKQNINIHETMSAHRKQHLKNPQSLFHKFLAWLMPPKSKQFLEKYEFFKATAEEKKSGDELENRSSTSSRRDGV